MTFLRLAISSFFIVAPGIAYFSGMDIKVAFGLLLPALWGLFSAAGEGALGLHHMDAYGPLSPYNDDPDSSLTTLGKVSAGVVALMGMVLLYFAASAYMDKKSKQPTPQSSSTPALPVKTPPTPATTPSPAPVPVKTPEVVKTPTPVAVKTPEAVKTPDAASTPVASGTPAPVASPVAKSADFEKLKFQAEGKVLSRDYKGAAEMLDSLEKQAPNDVDILFFRFLSYQGLGQQDKAKEYADRIQAEHPRSRYERRLEKFLKAQELGEKREKLGGDPSSFYAVKQGTSKVLGDDALFVEADSPSFDESIGSQIGFKLVSAKPDSKELTLEKGSEVAPAKSVHFLVNASGGQFAWTKSRQTTDYAELDLVWVKVTGGAKKGKQGWLLNNLKGVQSTEENPAPKARNVLGLSIIR